VMAPRKPLRWVVCEGPGKPISPRRGPRRSCLTVRRVVPEPGGRVKVRTDENNGGAPCVRVITVRGICWSRWLVRWGVRVRISMVPPFLIYPLTSVIPESQARKIPAPVRTSQTVEPCARMRECASGDSTSERQPRTSHQRGSANGLAMASRRREGSGVSGYARLMTWLMLVVRPGRTPLPVPRL
jgi:hypothetical protein